MEKFKQPNGSLFVNGTLLEGARLQEYAQRHGLCDICAQYQTHEKHGRFLNKVLIPLTRRNEQGSYEVYKGLCIQPTCYTLEQAKRHLGEIPSEPIRPPRNKARRKKANPTVQDSNLIDDEELAFPPSNNMLESPSADIRNSENPPSYRNAPDGNNNVASRERRSPGALFTRSGFEHVDPSTPSSDHQNTTGRMIGPNHSSHLNLASLGSTSENSRENQIKASSLRSSPEVQQKANLQRHVQFDAENASTSVSNDYDSTPNGQRVVHHQSANTATIPIHLQAGTEIPFPSLNSSSCNSSLTSTDSTLIMRREAAIAEAFERFKISPDADFVPFMTVLESASNKPEVVIEGLELLRQKVLRKHKEKPKIYVFANDTWVKSLKSILADCRENVEVQERGLFTMWVLSAISFRYMNEIGRYGGVKEFASALSTFRGNTGMEETCCGALEMFLAHENGGFDVPSEIFEPTVLALINIIATTVGDGSAKIWALRALLNLSQKPARPINTKSMCELIRNSASNGQRGIDAILDIARATSSSSYLVESAICIISVLSTPQAGSPAFVASEMLVTEVITIMENRKEPSILEAAYDLLANLLGHPERVSNSVLPLAWVPQVTTGIVDSLRSYQSLVGIQIAGLRVLCTILYDLERRINVKLDQTIRCIIGSMKANGPVVEIQSLGCLALAYLCSTSEEFKVSIAANGGVEVVTNVVRSCMEMSGISKDTPESKQAKHELTTHACIALTSMAVSSSLLFELGASEIFVDLAKAENMALLSALPQNIHENVVNTIARSKVGLSSLSRALSVLMNKYASMEEIESSISSIFELSVNSSETLDRLMAANDGTGTARIAELMTAYEHSVIIRDNGCALLAGIYVRVPFQGELNQRSRIELNSKSLTVYTHSVDEMNALRACLRTQKTEQKVVARAALAMSNFFSGSLTDLNLETSLEMRSIFAGTLKEFVNVMGCHEEDMELQTNCLRCIRIVLYAAEDMELKRWGSHIVERITCAMKNFKICSELQLNACLALLIFIDGIEDQMALSRIGRVDGITVLLGNLCTDNEDVVDATSELIAVVSRKLFTAVSDIMLVDDSICDIVNCMFRFADSSRIQAHCSCILWSLATLHEPFVKGVIVTTGGLDAILTGMRIHRRNEIVQEYGCKALDACFPAMRRGWMDLARNDLATIVHHALGMNGMNDEIETSAMKFATKLCGRDDFFKEVFSDPACINFVVVAMNSHICNQDLQIAGITMLWVLSSFGKNKYIIGEIGGLHVMVNALLGHIIDKQLQVDVMKVLKNLATTTENKRKIREVQGETAIVCSMWVNMDTPDILGAAFSALNNIAVDTENKVIAPLSTEMIQCVLFAMRKHPQSLAVQENGCFLLKSHTFSPSNMEIMKLRKKEIDEVLILALFNFREKCCDRAQYILGALES